MSGTTEITPSKIEHLVDTDLDPKTGKCSYHYNYLLYTFDHPLGPIRARSYLDTPKEVTILKSPSEANLDQILDYLHARYRKLKRR